MLKDTKSLPTEYDAIKRRLLDQYWYFLSTSAGLTKYLLQYLVSDHHVSIPGQTENIRLYVSR